MKKTVIIFLWVMSAVSGWAQSTCETRVDAHQQATTNQRVNYCLVPGYGDEAAPGPHLIFSATESYTAPQEPPVRSYRVTAPKGYFDDADIEVTHSFVQTRQFPKFTDGLVSEQYKREYREAMVSGPETAQEAISQTECEPEFEGGYDTDGDDENAAGVQARQEKPGRRLIKPRVSKKSSVTTGLENVEEIAASVNQDAYEASYAPAYGSANPATETEGYVPAGIADMPNESSQDLATEAYSYVPVVPENISSAKKKTADTSDEIAAGEYSYAPASYGESSLNAETVESTLKQEEPVASVSMPKANTSDDEIAVGEYSYAPASYGESSSNAETVESTLKQEEPVASVGMPKASTSDDEIAVGEYSYAPASYGSSAPAATETVSTESGSSTEESSDEIAVGEYSYAPAQ